MFERTFGCYIMESEEAKTLRAEAMAIEGKLENERNLLVLGATMPDTGKFEDLSSVGLRSKLRVDPDERVRKACYDGLTKIGDFVTANGFPEDSESYGQESWVSRLLRLQSNPGRRLWKG